MTITRTWLAAAVALVCLTYSHPVYAQAYCALRDPVQTIYSLFPAASSYESVVATVGDHARDEIARRLDMPLHAGELGRHTLYVALKGGKPLGLVHVRSERTQWGLAEVAWALDLDLRIIDFRIQRSRSPNRDAIEAEVFRSQLRGKTSVTLAALLSGEASGLDSQRVRVSADDHALADAVIRSGLKAIVATDSVWSKDIRRFRASSRQ